jgi:hypothetical protein
MGVGVHFEPDVADGTAACVTGDLLIDTIGAIFAAVAVFFRNRLDTSLEVLALRHPYRYAIFDHDSKFNTDVVRLLTRPV